MYLQIMERIGSMLSFLTIIFAILLCLCHRIIISAVLMTMDKIPQVYKMDAAAQPSSTPEQHISTLLLLLPLKDEHKATVKLFDGSYHGYYYRRPYIHLEEPQIQLILMTTWFLLLIPNSRWLYSMHKTNIFVEICKFMDFKNNMGAYCICGYLSSQMKTYRIS